MNKWSLHPNCQSFHEKKQHVLNQGAIGWAEEGSKQIPPWKGKNLNIFAASKVNSGGHYC